MKNPQPLVGEIADVESCVISVQRSALPLGYAKNVMGPWPMQEVVPRAVRAAVRIDTIT